MSRRDDYIQVAANATIGQALRCYVEREGQWWWLLITEVDGEYRVCSFGSLLPYLTGHTSHIVHKIGDCAICSGMDPVLWRDTGPLVEEALPDEAICSRLVGDLPMASLPIIDAKAAKELPVGLRHMTFGPVVAMVEDGAVTAVEVEVMRGDPGGLPNFQASTQQTEVTLP